MLARTIFFITFLGLLSGCMNASREFLSSKLQSTSALRPAYKPADIVEVRWTPNAGGATPDYLRLEYSNDNGASWTTVESRLDNDGEYDWNISTLPPMVIYKVRLIVVIKQSSEIIDLGSFLLDNQPPVVGADQIITVIEDTVTPFVLNTPTENDQYHIQIVTAPARGVLTGCLSGLSILSCVYTPNLDNDIDDFFTYKIVDRAGNESALATVTLNLIPVNDVPVITTLACPAKVGEYNNYSCVIQATDVDLPSPLMLAYKFDPSTTCGGWLTINSVSGEVSGTPSSAELGTCRVSVYAEDDVGGESERFSWDLTVEHAAPIIVVTGGPYSILEDSPLTVVIPGANVTSAKEGGGNFYSLVTPTTAGDHCEDHAMAPLAANYKIDPSTGEFSFSPEPDYQGVCHIRIALTDSFPSSGYVDVAITVINTPDPPVVAANLAPCSATAMKRTPYSCTVAIVDPDPEIVTVTRDASDTCSWLTATPSANGRSVTITGTPKNNNVGSCTLAIRATDPEALTDMQSLVVTVQNAEPTLTIGTPRVLTEDDPSFVSLVEVLSDADVQSLDEGMGTYSLIYTGLTGTPCNDPSVVVTPATDFVINSATGAVSIKPMADYFGTCYAKIQFDDGNGAANSVVNQEIAIIVLPVNDPPSITSIPASHEILLNPSGTTSSSFNLNVSVGPPNENDQSVKMICTNSNPARLTVNCSQTRIGDGTLTINLTATAGVDASAVVTVKVKDDGGGDDESAISTVNVSMTDAVVLTPIAVDTANYDIYNKASAQYNGTVAASNRTFVVTVNSGVKVLSNDPALPAMTTGMLSAGARVRLINNGQIIGAFGNGGLTPGGTPGALKMGQTGGTAFRIEAQYNKVTILNNGVIYGGGGGGGRGSTDGADGGGGAGGVGEGPNSSASTGTAGTGGGAGGAKATSLGGGATPAGNYTPSNGFAQTSGSSGQGGSSCLIGAALGNSPGEANFGRGGFGAGYGGGAGACSQQYGGGGGGGYYGGGGGSGGLTDMNDGGNINTDLNGYNGGHGGAAIEVPSGVVNPGDINIIITPGGGSQIAGCVWNDISGKYLTGIMSDSDVNNRALTFSSTTSQNVNAPTGIKFWNNGRGKAYR